MTDTEGEASLGVSIVGPGPAHAELADNGDGTTEVLTTARTAGDYVLSVSDLASGASLFGSPYKVLGKHAIGVARLSLEQQVAT